MKVTIDFYYDVTFIKRKLTDNGAYVSEHVRVCVSKVSKKKKRKEE